MRIVGAPDAPALNNINQVDKNESPQIQPPAVTEAKETVDGKLASYYAEQAKREKVYRSKVQAREQALKAREDAFAAKEKEYETSYIPKKQIPEMFHRDPYGFMKDNNINGDQLTQALLNQPSPQDRVIQELQQQVAALKGIPDQTKNLLDEREKMQREQALHVIRSDVKSLVNSDPNLEMIKSTGSEEEVVKKIEDTLDKEGIILSAQEAAEAIEKEVTEGLVKIFQSSPKSLDKILAIIRPAVQVQNQKLQIQPQTKTLAHSQVSSAQKPMSARERAIAMLEGN